MAQDPFADFDEAKYLAANPDIRDAIASGVVSSGLAHYRRFGRHEQRAGSPSRPSHQPLETMPPEALRVRVSGFSDITTFDLGGRAICDDILDAATAHQVVLNEDTRVLDFGCGCGRVLRHLAPRCAARIDGVDIDAEAIEWCRVNFGAAATFQQNPEWPPLPFEDARFDFIYSVSVFTHLPEAMQKAWLTELRRVAKPGASLFLSIHAPDLMPIDDLVAAKHMEEHGFCYLRNEATSGLPDFYRVAYHAESYIRSEWGKLFEIEAVIRHGVNDHQDLVVARKR